MGRAYRRLAFGHGKPQLHTGNTHFMTTTAAQQPGPSGPQVQTEEDRRLDERMGQIGRKLIVLSGKGGVGKSTVAANLAAALAVNHKVGLLDVDIHGPSIPRLMGIGEVLAVSDGSSLVPVQVSANLSVMSIGLLLRNATDAVIWRGPVKFGVIRQFLSDVAWGPLDFLVVDCPPGTGDEPLSVVQMAGASAAGVIVTTPQELAVSDVRRCVTFCRQVGLPVAGIVENMSGFECPHCQAAFNLFGQGGGAKLAHEMDVPFLGAIPIDPSVVSGGDSGKPFAADDAPSAVRQAFLEIVGRIERTPAAVAHECCGRHHGKDAGKPEECGHGKDPSHHCTCR
jgi:ATP-binding protein involved in chromosome partitioning